MRTTFKFLIPVLALIAPWSVVSAATIAVTPAQLSAKPGEAFLVTVKLDTEGDQANAYQGTLVFPSSLALGEIRDAGSIVTLWIEPPRQTAPGEVSFAGVTTGGFSGPSGTLFSVVLTGPKNGSADVSLRDLSVLRNDGKGTAIAVKSVPMHITISPLGTAGAVTPAADATPPEAPSVTVTSDPSLYGGAPFASFAAVDPGSGIDHYEVAERDLLNLFVPDADLWATATSPYPLSDKSQTGILKVKAVDRAGNARTVVVPEPRHYAALGILGIGILGLIVLLVTMI